MTTVIAARDVGDWTKNASGEKWFNFGCFKGRNQQVAG